MKPLSLLILAATATLSLPACARVGGGDEAFGKKVRAYLLEHPEVLEEVVAKLDEKKQAQAAEARKASLAAIPTLREALERDGRDLVANPNGTVTVVQFADYRCGYCKTAAPEIQALIKADPDIRVVFKEFPIFGGVSDTAAKIALTPQVKAQGLAFYHDWMAEKALDDGAIDRRLQQAGLDPATVRKAAEAPDIAAHIAATRKLAMALNIQGTPAYVVGDVMVPGADMEALKAAILKARLAKAKTITSVGGA
jgi:protein-disulfide isomerase